MSDSSDKEKLDGITTPHGPAAERRTHPGGNSKGTCTQRSVTPPTTGHQSTGHRPLAQLTRRHRLVTSHWSNGHYTRIFKSVSHRSPAIHPPVIGLREYQHRGKSIYTGHLSPVIRLYINLHLLRLMPWAWSSLIITQKEF